MEERVLVEMEDMTTGDDVSVTTVYVPPPRRDNHSKWKNPKKERTCPICYETLPAEGDVEEGHIQMMMTRVEGCNHYFCRACLKGSIHSDIAHKKIPCRCPMAACTNNMLPDAFVERALFDGKDQEHRQPDPEATRMLEKYHRILTLKQNPQSVECVKCHNVFLPVTDTDPDKDVSSKQKGLGWMMLWSSASRQASTDTTDVVCCTHCPHRFCRTHGDAHAADTTCRAWYQTTDGKRARQSEKKLHRATKPCPHCSIRIQKVEVRDTVCKRMRRRVHFFSYSLVSVFLFAS